MSPLVDATTLESPSEIDIPIPTDDGLGEAITAVPDATYAPAEPEMPTDSPPGVFVPKSPVYGRYLGVSGSLELELRVDVDGPRALKRVSGDFWSKSGNTKSYVGSFVAKVVLTTTASEVKAAGKGQFTWNAGAPNIQVTIPRVSLWTPKAPATLKFFTDTNTPGATYLCNFTSWSYRTLEYEQDSVQGTVPFTSYNTGSLPQPPGSAARDLTVAKAFGEAGVNVVTRASSIVPVSGAGAGASWSDSELHTAMTNHFSAFADTPQWKVWMLVATRHDGGYRGIMFDYNGAFQRQGAAVFYDAIQGNDAISQRAQLRTYVHELGHALNLLHSWDKAVATPPQPLGPSNGYGDLSWMNYAWKYQPGGEPAYWSNFAFQFTDNELAHLRHGFFRNVSMGGNAFLTGAAEVDPELFAAPIEDNSGLALDLRSKATFDLGEPVVVELKLDTTDLRGRVTHARLNPKEGLVKIAIRQPSGRTVLYRPLVQACSDDAPLVRLDANAAAKYDSSFIGFGSDGFYFDEPGRYQLRAQYLADDGSRVVSPVLTIWVRPPATAADQQVAELLIGEEQGQLLYFLGSDSDSLQRGNDAMDEVLDRYADHPLAVYPRLVKGVNAQRDYKKVTPDNRLQVRAADTQESIQQLSSVVEASVGDGGVDNITLNMTMRTLATAEAKAGNTNRAGEVLDQMVQTFTDKGLRPAVVNAIRQDAEDTRQALFGGNGHGR